MPEPVNKIVDEVGIQIQYAMVVCVQIRYACEKAMPIIPILSMQALRKESCLHLVYYATVVQFFFFTHKMITT